MKMHFTKMLGVCCGLLALIALSTTSLSAQCDVDGGELISTAPDNRFCLGTESPLIVEPELVGNVGDNSLWVLTPQANKDVLASSTTGSDWDLNDFPDGNYRIWHVSYADGEDLADVLASPWTSGSGCWDNSNAYRVRLRSNEEVTIASDSETSFCAGEAGDFDATKSPNMGANGVWALTDDSGEAVEIKWNNPNFDLDALAPGSYTVYFVNWSPNFNPIPTVTNLADLEACVGVSNGIELTVLDCDLDCPEQGANIGDACEIDGEAGTINEDCECEVEGCVEVPVLDETCIVDIESEAYATVIAEDPFCCDVQWDGLCQSSYAEIACAPEFDCPELEANIGDDCGVNGTVSEDCECVEPQDDCLNTSQWPSFAVTQTGAPGVQTISTCVFLSEYSEIANIISGETYSFTATGGAFITLRQGSFDGEVVASGFSPLTYTADSDANLFPHYNTDEDCGTATGCNTNTIECTTCVLTFDCPDLEANIGDDCGTNGTVSEDCECVEPEPVDGDTCADATPISCGDTATGSTVGATFSGTSFCGTSHTSPDVWYALTLDTDGEVTATTCGEGSNFDTKLTVFSGDCGALTCVGGNDDSPCEFGGLLSTVNFEGVAGTTYYIMVHGFSTSTGDYELSVTCDEGEPGFDCPELEANIGDDCGDNGTVSEDCECVEPIDGDNCATATPIVCGDLVVGTTEGATFSDAGTCGTTHTSPDVWYVFTLEDDAEVDVNTFGSAFDTKLTVWTGSCGSLVCVDGNDDTNGLQSQVTFDGTAGTTYYIMVHGFGSLTGVYNLEVVCDTPPEVDCPELGANLGDPCTTDEGAPGTVNEFCECEADEIVCDVVPEGEFFCQVDITSAAFAEVQATDPFCCNTSWDGLCQSSYDALGGPANPDPACEETFDCPELEANIGDDCGVNGTINADCECVEASPIDNDTCAEATAIACGETATGSTADATFSDAGFCGTGHTSPEVWYVLTPDADGVVDVNTFGSTFDTKLTVWTGSCGAPVCVGGNDDTGGLQSQVIFDGTAGTTYYIMVHGFGTATGNYELSVTCTPYDCPDLGANIGDSCDADGEPGEVNEACECVPLEAADGCGPATIAFGSFSLTGDPGVNSITTCAFFTEYSTVNGAVAGSEYEFTAINSGEALYITLRSGTSDGPVVAFGPSPLAYTATSSDALYLHYSLDEFCNVGSGCIAATVECTSCEETFDCPELEANIGDACDAAGESGEVNDLCECEPLGPGPDCSPGTGCTATIAEAFCCLVDVNSTAYATVVGLDPFCCNTSWDGLCQSAYDDEGGPANPSCDDTPIILGAEANGNATLSSYPNPTPSTSFVTFTIDEPQQVTVEVYDMSGRRIQTLFHQSATANQDYVLQFDGSGLPSGVYIYRMTTENEVIIDKFIIRR